MKWTEEIICAVYDTFVLEKRQSFRSALREYEKLHSINEEGTEIDLYRNGNFISNRKVLPSDGYKEFYKDVHYAYDN